MASVNKVILVGNVGKDPEIRSSQAGKSVANFSLATQEGYGENRSTAWHNIICFDKNADVVGQYLRKGEPVYIEGRITYEQWEDKKDGSKRTATKIVADRVQLLAGKKSDDGDRLPDRQPTRREEPTHRNTRTADKPTFPNDDDMPF